MKGKLQHKDVLKLIFAGKATLTFHNLLTNNWFTYKIIKSKDSNLFFVKVLTSPNKYTFIGTIFNGKYYHGKKSTICCNAQSVKVFNYVYLKLLINNLQDFIEIYHSGRCCKCGLKLTTKESIERGLGPKCSTFN